jgi:hypothetical protein
LGSLLGTVFQQGLDIGLHHHVTSSGGLGP